MNLQNYSIADLKEYTQEDKINFTEKGTAKVKVLMDIWKNKYNYVMDNVVWGSDELTFDTLGIGLNPKNVTYKLIQVNEYELRTFVNDEKCCRNVFIL